MNAHSLSTAVWNRRLPSFFPSSPRNRAASVRLLLLAMLVCLLAACGDAQKLAPLSRDAVVLALGDSVTYGTGAERGQDWPTLLAARTGWQVVNAGIPGDTADGARQRIAPLLDEHRPALLIVEIGGNDLLRRRPPAAVKEDIRAILAAARAARVPAVLVAVPEPSFMAAAGSPSDAALYKDLGKEENVPVIEDVFSDVLGRSEWRADQVHPNAAGYREMAEGLERALRKLGLMG